MNKYEKVLMDIFGLYAENEIWIKDNGVRVGYSIVEIDIDWNDDGGINYVTTFSAEKSEFSYENCDAKKDYKTLDEYMTVVGKYGFVITLDKAQEGNFITWNEFKAEIDRVDEINKSGGNEKYYLDIFSL